ncbi:MAG: DUF4288 domain-containing protein [Cyanobacteria bacterium J06635_13]
MTVSNQSFYIAVILYKSSSDSEDQPLYQECFTLIKASSIEEAHKRTEDYAKKAKCSYTAEDGRTISLSLERIVDVNNVLYNDFQNGTDIYARHFRNFAAYSSFEPLILGEDI